MDLLLRYDLRITSLSSGREGARFVISVKHTTGGVISDI